MCDLEKTSILMVDDLPEKLLAYRAILEEQEQPGLEIVTARTGEEALRRVLKTDFAVILMDVQMPGMNGFEAAHLIRSRRRSAHTPIIFLTAFVDEVQTSKGYATGAVDYMSTPVVPEVLRAKVRVFVELFRMRQQVARQAEEAAKRAAAEEAAARAAFLSEASRALANSIDLEETVRALARLAVPDLADVSAVVLADGRAEADWLGEHVRRVLASPGGEQRVALDEPRPMTEGGEAVDSVLLLPLAARGRTLGALVLGARPGRTFGAEEASLAGEVAGRAGVALDNAMLVRDIQEDDRRRNEFLAMLSHELRNPLAPVRNALKVLQSSGIQHPTLDWAGGLIERQVLHMVRLVDDLLDVSRITRGKIHLREEEVDVADVVAEAVETSRPLIEAHRHALSVSVPEGPVWLRADRTRLSQVLSNLLNNAAKYTPDGGRIGLSVERDGAEVVIRVRDTGTGITREMLPRVFDLFTQADRGIDRSQGGLGIGLTLVRRLVEMHGGRVEAFSDGPGRGSEFVVTLRAEEPRRAEEQGQRAEERRGEPGGSVFPLPSALDPPPLRVLVVDDNVDAADSLAILLRITGHTTRLAHDGQAALEASAEFRPDVVLLDIGLPGLDGYQVARRMRADPATARSLIVAVSGYGQEEDRAKAKQAGFDHHLTKPVDYDDLQAVLSRRGAG